ncbi:hypothetical protein CFOLD11_12860 [Clostridium folliculivorans]|uniref:Uncharacterized protein n=1 Tax=Clostridium folliculivorans TaxID=2886038 RepID=A0A9W5Y0P6_9CLOT|nr:hypothetical protein [Clostridium folliculivorans]GKU24460.1 hypothetical protein CFOLD11_12860 [Clostridium folliculivorans]
MRIFQGTREFKDKDDLLKNIAKEEIGGEIYIESGTTVVIMHPGEILNRQEYSEEQWFQYAINMGRDFPSDQWYSQMKNKAKVESKDNKLNDDSAKTMNCSIYEKEAFFEIYPKANEDDYYKVSNPDSDVLAYMENLEKKFNIKINEMNFVCIDEEYFEWLKANNLEENKKNRLNYITLMEDDNIERLWNKNHRNQYILMIFLPVILYNEDSFKSPEDTIELDKQCVEFLTDRLSSNLNIPKDSLLILDRMIRPDVAIVNEDNFYELYYSWFLNNLKVEKSFLEAKSNDKLNRFNVFMRVIPIGILGKKTFKYTKEQAIIKSKTDIYKEFSKSLNESISSKLQEKNNYKVISTFGALIPSEAIEDRYNEFVDTLK